MLVFILVAGIEFAEAAGALGFALFVSRILFCFYLSKGGPKNILRSTGAIIGDLALLALLVLSIITCARHME
jgi:hypothetical protein